MLARMVNLGNGKVLRFWVLAFLWVQLGSVTSAWSATVLNQAVVTANVGGVNHPAMPVALPYQWDKLHGAVDGQARFQMRFDVADPTAPLALYIPRLGNTFAIWINGTQLDSLGTLPANLYDDAAMAPRYFVIPPHMLAPTTVMEIEIGATRARQAGLSQVTVGTEREVSPIYRAKYHWQVTGAHIVVAVSSVLGLISMLLWFRLRKPAYLAYGLGELLWTAQTMRILVEDAPLPWPWWGVIPLAAFNAAPPLLCVFALLFMGVTKSRVITVAYALIVLAVPAALLIMLGGMLWLAPVFQAVITLTSVAMAWVVLTAAVQSATHERRMLAMAVGVIVACAVRDVLTMRLSANSYDIVPWVRFAWVGFGLSMAWIVTERLRKDHAAVNAEFGAAFEGERAEAKRNGAKEERQRLMQDLHDGLGSQLVGALRVAQQPTASRDEITRQLRGAVDQLKITVDAMHETDGDITSVMAATRYRLAPRLQAAGIDLQWDVAQLPIVPSWGVRQSYQLQMILFEAFTNMVVHSEARSASLRARVVEGDGDSVIEITISDNGRGFDLADPQSATGRGLSNMQSRAQTLGVNLKMSSMPGNTCICLRIPVA
jgi:signal transduction histidine kinase